MIDPAVPNPSKSEALRPSNLNDEFIVDEMYLPNGKLNAAYLLKNADLLRSVREFASARKIYQALIRDREGLHEALLGMAVCYEQEGRTEDALKSYEDTILFAPTVGAYQALGQLLSRLGRHQQSAEVFERAASIRDLFPEIRAHLHEAAGKGFGICEMYAKAERHFRRALELQPYSDGVATSLGALFIQQGRTADAEAIFEEALRINPKNSQALSGLATVHLARNEKQKAFDRFESSLRVNLKQPQSIFQLVKLAYELKRFSPAEGILREYIEAAPFNANLLYSLAGIQYHLGLNADALRTSEQILSIQPGHVEARNLIQRIQSIGSSQ